MTAIRGGRVSPATSFNVLGMVGITGVRVLAAQHRHELLLAAKLRADAKALERAGALPEERQRYAGQLDTFPVGINPQQSIPTMTTEQYTDSRRDSIYVYSHTGRQYNFGVRYTFKEHSQLPRETGR